MFYVKWGFLIIVWSVIGGFLHYTLPQHDVVRIVNTEVQRVDFGANSVFWASGDTGSQAGATVNRDVRFIEAFYENDRPMVYRNEDTGWGWPPYFKLDSSNLQAEARDLVSTKSAPQWVVIRHYGWRNEFLSIFPNAVEVRAVAQPDVRIVPWVNIVILTLLAAFVWAVWVRWRRFRAARIDPALREVADSWEAAGDAVDDGRGRIRRWIAGLRGK
ncbi:MAG: DUF1523 family protein [Rhodobacteraceae bacterium]|nr:DUF1523 family protein [Paracoccaceae bacterium]